METWWSIGGLGALARAATVLAVGLVLAHLVRSALGRVLGGRATAQHEMLAKRVSYYLILGLTVVVALRQLGFEFTVLLGAAGILTVALGFASQTSASNLISGLFLVAEQAFVVGEVIRIGNTTGEVIAVDLLSVKLRTFDNLLVRLPNELVIRTEMTNLTRMPIRRYDLQLAVAYKEDLARVRGLLLEVAARNPVCLREPTPQVIFQSFGESGVNIQCSVWAAREHFLQLRNSIAEDVKAALDAAGVEMPFPHVSLYRGTASKPITVTLVPGVDAPAAGPTTRPAQTP
jgi:small-conductance mechanosensitive channel